MNDIVLNNRNIQEIEKDGCTVLDFGPGRVFRIALDGFADESGDDACRISLSAAQVNQIACGGRLIAGGHRIMHRAAYVDAQW